MAWWRGGILLVLVQSAWPQTGVDAASLVRSASAAALAAKSWEAEGKLVRSENGKDQAALAFHMWFQPPRYARLEIRSGDIPLTRVCEGTAQWTYFPDLKGFIRVLLPQIGPCAFPLNAWAPLSITLPNPAAGTTDTISIDGHPQTCRTVRSPFTWQGRDPAVKETVTLCIAAEQSRILRYRIEHTNPAPAWAETYTFSSLKMDQQLPANLFDFQAPEGSHAFATIDWLSPIPPTPGVNQVSDAVSAPILLEMTPAIAPAEAALVEEGNTVALHVQIGRDGLVHSVEVSRSLGTGMDEAAQKAVKQWRFKPGESASGPVAVAGTILVHFMGPMTK